MKIGCKLITGSVWNGFKFPCGMLESAVWMYLKTQMCLPNTHCFHFFNIVSPMCVFPVSPTHSDLVFRPYLSNRCCQWFLPHVQFAVPPDVYPFCASSCACVSNRLFWLPPCVQDLSLFSKYFCLYDSAYLERKCYVSLTLFAFSFQPVLKFSSHMINIHL